MALPSIEEQGRGRPATWAYTAFGVSFEADFDMPGLPSTALAGTERRCSLRLVTDARGERQVTNDDGELLFEQRVGRHRLTLTHCDDETFRFWSSSHGTFFVGGHGDQVYCLPVEGDPWHWRRFLIAQVMPLVALLAGYETIHASAVALDGHALLVTGPSRVGKTSVAAHLIASGAAFLADDVVALERRDGTVLAHPGVGMVGIRHAELARPGGSHLARLGAVLASNPKEVLLAVPEVSDCRPVRSVYLPEHVGEGADAMRFVTIDDPRFLLGSTFNNVLRTPERLTAMLDLYSAVSRTASVHRVYVPAATEARELALAIAEREREPEE